MAIKLAALEFKELTFSLNLIPAVICLIAGLIYLFHYRNFNKKEKLIVWVIWLNILADIASYFIMHIPDHQTAFIYNVMTPIEKIIILIAYGQNTFAAKRRPIYSWGILAVILLTALDISLINGFSSFNVMGVVSTGMIVAFLSYIHLRDVLNNRGGESKVFTLFCSANFVYYTLMVSSLSAVQLAQIVGGKDFASKVSYGNLMAYAIWSIILIVGLLWTRKN
jgi:hypothetical protein